MTRVDTPPPSTTELVPFTEAHLEGALALSQAVSWPHRIEDWLLNLSVSQGVAAIENGRVVGTALCSFHGPVATLNMIIVDETMRGRGLGRRVMEAAIALAGDREMRLVATPEGLPLYRKLGFEPCGRIVQLRGTAHAASPEQPVSADPVDPDQLAEMDRDASGMERLALLTRIAETGETLTTEGGFALLRRFGRGYVLGPVVARNAAAARSLIAEAAARMNGQLLRIDVPEEHGLAPFIEGLGLPVVGDGTAMVRAPRARASSLYQTHALISQALG